MRPAVQTTWTRAPSGCRDEDRSDIDLGRLVAGDSTAFAALYQRHAPQVFWYFRSRTHSPEHAADLTQEAFLRCFEALPRYEDRGVSFRAWFFRIVRNLAIDESRRRHRRLAREAAAPISPAPPPEPEAVALLSEETAELHALIAQLDPDKRELLALHYAAGLSIAEIAAVRGMGQWAVRKRLQRIIGTVRKTYSAGGRQP